MELMLIKVTQMNVVMSKMAAHPLVETLHIESFPSSRNGFNKLSGAVPFVPCMGSRKKVLAVSLLHDNEHPGIEQRNLQLIGLCVMFGASLSTDIFLKLSKSTYQT